MRTVELQGIDNVRDLGGIPVASGRAVVPGLLFRGSALAGLTERDCERLFGELGIRCVIDVRCGWERDAKPDVEAPGVENLHIPFYDIDKVGIEYIEPAEGTKVVGRDVACVPEHFYRSLANPLTAGQMRVAVGEVFTRAMAGEPVYLHCSGGKDRAGILTLLILSVLGARRETILDDYLFTNVARDKNYDKMLERFLRLADGDEARAHELVIAHRAVPGNLEAFYSAVESAYGDWDSFVRTQLGISDARREELRATLTA